MSKHTMKAVCPFGLDGIWVEINFSFSPGSPAILYGDAPQPADPAEIELISVTYADSINDAMAKMLEEWAVEYLADEGLVDAMEEVASDHEAAREYAAELRADR